MCVCSKLKNKKITIEKEKRKTSNICSSEGSQPLNGLSAEYWV